MSTMRDEAAKSKAVQAITVANGAAYDGTDLTGEEIDRAPGGGNRYMSAKLVAETGNGSASDVVVLKVWEADEQGGSYTVNADAGSITLNEAAEFDTLDIDLSGLKRYVQIQSEGDDNTVSSTTDLAAYLVLSGATDQPVSDG